MYKLVVVVVVLVGAFAVFRKSFNTVRKGVSMKLTSQHFEHMQQLYKDQTCDGLNKSPQLSWGPAPAGTQSFALICDDPDAPAKTWVHWLIYNIPATTTSLDAGVSKDARLPNDVLQGTTSFGTTGFGGACPPKGHGTHRYFFKIFALDSMLNLEPGATVEQLQQAMQAHILASGELVGLYSRD